MEGNQEPIAIIGYGLRLPGGIDEDKGLWEVLANAKNLMTEWPKSRTTVGALHDSAGGRLNTLAGRGAHFLKDDFAVFDAPFFSITSNEAAAMDPQQRWVLETAYHAFENAGLPVENLRGTRTAVFGASMADDYSRIISKDPDTAPRMAATGIEPSCMPNRVSWYFHLRGPSVLVNTACSGSLVALDLACQSMRCGDASMALVFGSSMLLSPETSLMLSNMKFLSPDSKCFSFDHRANGYGRGEGVVAMVLKPLGDALRDGDVVRAVLRATGSNQDGQTLGLTQPSAEAQETLIRHVYKKANLSFSETRYVEAHGTGTPTGDPIEMKGIGRVFRSSRSAQEPLYVGSVKSNIGHLEGGSGLAGLMKVVLALEKGNIPPNALFEKMNPAIDAEFYHLSVPTKMTAWPKSGLRRASVNSFGFGGSNAHVIVDDAYSYLRDRGLRGNHNCTTAEPQDDPIPSTGNLEEEAHAIPACVPGHRQGGDVVRLLVWSAADRAAITRVLSSAQQYYSASVSGNSHKLNQLAHTLATRRTRLPWRSFAVVNAMPGNVSDSDADDGLLLSTPVRASSKGIGVAFVFTGQGAQYTGMGKELMRYKVFEDTLRRVNSVLERLGFMFSAIDALDDQERIDDPEISQPLCTALQLALVELLRSFGIHPIAVVGHSSGEIAAAYALGALSFDSACKVAYCRGKVVQILKARTRKGAMMSVNIPHDKIQDYVGRTEGVVPGSVHVACVNSPLNSTLSGNEENIDAIKKKLDGEGIFAQKLKTGVAYHSPAMSEVAHDYLNLLGSLEPGTINGGISLISSVTGGVMPVASTMSSPSYWVENLVSTVQFASAIESMVDPVTLPVGVEAITDIIEVGPHAALRRPILDTLASATTEGIRYHSTLQRSKPALRTSLGLIGDLFCHGYPVLIDVANWHDAATSVAPLVDYPQYPFDHSRRYWTESRFSKDFRLRSPSVGYLLGRASHDFNPLRPAFRNWLSVESLPWLGDHVIGDMAICPGAGMIVMAIEAVSHVRQLASGTRAVSGFFIKQAQFLRPIPISNEAQGAPETYLCLRPMQIGGEEKADHFDVSIFRCHEDSWTECFRADVLVQYQERNQLTVDGGQESRLQAARIRDIYSQAKENCVVPIGSDPFYNFLRERGLHYGPTFRLLHNMAWDASGTSTAELHRSPASHHLSGGSSPVHPAELDAAVHLILVQVSRAMSSQMPTFVPQTLSNVWLSASPWLSQGRSVRLASIVRESNSRGIGGSIYALNDDDKPLLSIEKVLLVPVSLVEDAQETDMKKAMNILYEIQWKPKFKSFGVGELQRLCDTTQSSLSRCVPSRRQQVESINAFMLKAARRAVKLLPVENSANLVVSSHLSRFRAYLERISEPVPASGDNNWDEIETSFRQGQGAFPGGPLFASVARNLPQILDGKCDALELLFEAGHVNQFYDYLFTDLCDGGFNMVLELASHENPGMRIIEVGAGTGGMTQQVLSTLQELERRRGYPSFAEYTYTDISPVFFESAMTRFGEYTDRLVFEKLDLEKNAGDQGFELGAYDLVIAGSVLHATAQLKDTLDRVRSLLRPGGHLIMAEVTLTASPWAHVCWGSLPGWWLSGETWRQNGPLVSQRKWEALLLDAGFSGLQYSREDEYGFNLMVSQVIEVNEVACVVAPYSEPSGHKLVIVIDPSVTDQVDIAFKISTQRLGVRIITLDRVQQEDPFTDVDIVVSLLEFGASSIARADKEHFQALQHLVIRAQNLVWVVALNAEAAEDSIAYPHYSISTGFLRVIRSEYPTKRIVSLFFESLGDKNDSKTSSLSDQVGIIARVIKDCYQNPAQSNECEFLVRDGILNIGRMVEVADLEEETRAYLKPRFVTEPWNQGPPIALTVGTPGLLDTLRFVEDLQYTTQLGPEEVVIAAKAWPISFRDVMIAIGRLGLEGLGFECAGIVTRAGTTTDFQPGDRVLMVAPGCMRSSPRAHADAVFRIPDGVSLDDAVASLNPGMTAYQALVNIAGLKRGDKILIHSAAGSTGQMAIWLAKRAGAEIFATVGYEGKKQLLMRTFGIPKSHIFYSRDTSFAAGIMRVTNGYGVDVVLNSLTGDKLQASWGCIAPYGRFIEIGKMDINNNVSLPMAYFAKNVSFSAVDLFHIVQTNQQLARDLAHAVINMLAEGEAACPSPLHTYPVTEIEQAFRFMQSGKNTGRILVHVDGNAKVPKLIKKTTCWRFDPHAAYIVSGGLGGIGRTIVRWMSNRGARNLIVPSRSGASSQAAADLVSQLRSEGLRVMTPKCDIGLADEVTALLHECSEMGFAPIKGCINASMALHDAVFENMTYDQWETTIRSKVGSSWNLHSQLPRDLDFFILLSSLSGIYGSLAQSNYAAGCTFQDALAHHRNALGFGKTSVSLDLGWVKDVGIIAEREDYRQNRGHARDMKQINAAEVLALLDVYCNPESGEAQGEGDWMGKSQLLVGAVTPLDTYRWDQPPTMFETNPLLTGFRVAADLERQSNNLPQRQQAGGGNTSLLFRQAADTSAQAKVVETALKGNLARALGIAIEEVDDRRRLSNYGVDSLMALELRNWIQHDFHAAVAVFEIMNSDMSIVELGRLVVERAEDTVE